MITDISEIFFTYYHFFYQVVKRISNYVIIYFISQLMYLFSLVDITLRNQH